MNKRKNFTVTDINTYTIKVFIFDGNLKTNTQFWQTKS